MLSVITRSPLISNVPRWHLRDHWRNQPYDALSGALILRNDSTAREHQISVLEFAAFAANYSQQPRFIRKIATALLKNERLIER